MLLTLFSLLFSQPLWATIETSETTNYYAIQGESAQQLRQSLNFNSPIRQNGHTHDAETRWNISWNYDYVIQNNVCRINNSKIHVKIIYQYPQWVHSETASQSLRDHWERYRTELTKHEQGHADFAHRAANDIDIFFQNYKPEKSCPRLGNRLNAQANKIISKYTRLEKEYDRETHHGMRTNAVFP